MIKLNRTTEYGLIALRHMSRKQSAEMSGVTSAREISDQYGFPFEITAKTLQRLRDTGLIDSAQGARGGYTLRRALAEVSLAEFLRLMEGPQAIVSCALPDAPEPKTLAESGDCAYAPRCEVKTVMNDLNQRVFQFLSGICLAELTSGAVSANSVPVTWFQSEQASGGESSERKPARVAGSVTGSKLGVSR